MSISEPLGLTLQREVSKKMEWARGRKSQSQRQNNKQGETEREG